MASVKQFPSGVKCKETLMSSKDEDCMVVFRRFRRTRDGRLLDAHKYGLRAWPIKVRGKDRKK